MGRVANDEILNEKILVDLKEDKLKWGEIAKKHGVNMNYVRSVHSIYRNELTVANTARGGVVTYYKGSRVSDGKSSPVQKFNINDLSDEELDKMGLGRFKKNA